MPRLSQADAALVVRCLERVLEEGKVDSSIQDPRPVSQVLARLKTRLEQARAAPDPRPRPEGPFGEQPAPRTRRRAMVIVAREEPACAPRTL